MPVPPVVSDLVARFANNLESYRSGQYNETQVRREFLDPLFKALGWDMDNEQGYAEAYKDVIHEDQIRVGGAVKAPDYCFRIGGTRKFFLEAKKPAVVIKTDIPPAYQLRRYAWSAKLPLSILSDFEEFAVYDCRVKPGKDDPASTARVFYCTFREYAERWDWISSIFSRAAILKGSFDKYADSNKAKRGTSEVDNDFLATLEGWRTELARNLALRNPQLSSRELNFAVQVTLDRLIFLRIAEDRGLEEYGRLLALTGGQRLYPRLVELFGLADDRYNSGLFHFRSEKGREPPDELTPGLAVDDAVLKDILRNLYYPDCPYEFSVLSADLLGQVYERFLGQVIRLTEGHRAVVEAKPEVRKAGGVYYTPTYIVDYIVRQTVGQLVEGRAPKDVATLRVLDPACGSGSFLIGAYQFLLDWHLAWYLAHTPERWARGRQPALVQTPGGWRLTTAERKRLLLAHIHGVDIDPQAVEVTKLSLLLKVLEGENRQTLDNAYRLLHERALPDLSRNIKCGNSLIGPDFYQQAELRLDDEARYRLNVFDWQGSDGFPTIMGAGGFDAVIGNPPYVLLGERAEKTYLRASYRADEGKPDLFKYFIEKGHLLLSKRGYFGMIVPTSLLRTPAYRSCRSFILECASPCSITVFGGEVFSGVSVNSIVIITTRRHRDAVSWIEDNSQSPSAATLDLATRAGRSVSFASWQANPTSVFENATDSSVDLTNRITKQQGCVPLASLCEYTLGMQVYHNTLHTAEEMQNRIYHRSAPQPKPWYPESTGGNIKRYHFIPSYKNWVKPGEWCYIHPPARYYSGPRILVREITSSTLVCAYTEEEHIANKSVIIVRALTVDPFLILGILNSRLIGRYIAWTTEKGKQRLFPRISLRSLRSTPVPAATLGRAGDGLRAKVVALVRQIIDLHGACATTKTPHEQTALERQMAAVDGQIDRLVYELYGLTEAEIKIVEGTP